MPRPSDSPTQRYVVARHPSAKELRNKYAKRKQARPHAFWLWVGLAKLP